MTLLGRLSVLCLLGSAGTFAWAFEITTASTKSFESRGFHCAFGVSGAEQLIWFNDGGVASTGALVGIDGSTVLLPTQRLRWSPKRREGPKVNDRLQAIFKDGSTSMDIGAVVLKSCDGMPESCERWQYATTITVKHGGARKTLKGVSECGA